MSEPAGKQGDQPNPAYSREFPQTPKEQERATATHVDDEKAKQERPDPGDSAVPYRKTNLHGSNDTSRCSTPPPKNP
ncbi:MAG TPA: hypothetical protein VNQ32_07635 [Steroidobacteraceae bacterium]|nr:hypothetical protein [Steroidobacteraceae bacterium]